MEIQIKYISRVPYFILSFKFEIMQNQNVQKEEQIFKYLRPNYGG